MGLINDTNADLDAVHEMMVDDDDHDPEGGMEGLDDWCDLTGGQKVVSKVDDGT